MNLTFSSLPIGFFQFDNLVRNRVPFWMIKTPVDVQSYFGPAEKDHLQNYCLEKENWTLAEVVAALSEKQVRKDSPLLFICHDGILSKKLADEISATGFMNVYYLMDGVKSLEMR